ncbi:MAG TPA: AbrB/MazE/SpoVT family DNA-binding domain-containing protein [Agrobacterium sp.]|uniref:antitoxin n=1 Tax=Rhizobium sp. TaxID=391 RepID=UPI000E9DC035|nr:AbrB/MazE/SpoVT family DNA-binding domain-containing protein [Agrobacterium sp.]
MPHIARVFQSGNSQAVRLPKELRLDVDRVEITREGDALIVRPHIDGSEAWASLKNALERGVSDDLFSNGRAQPADQDRSELDDLFR